jgi:hypothetical protein
MGFVVEKGQDKEKKQFDLPKKGPRAAVLTGIVDCGIHVREYMGEKKKPCREFLPLYTLMSDEFSYEKDDGEKVEGKISVSPFPIKLMPGVTRGHYFDFCEALDGEHVVMADGAGDISKLLGSKCFVNIVYSDPEKTDGVTYANMKGISAIPEDYPVADYDGEFIVFDTGTPDRAVFEALRANTKEQIRTSEGYAGSALEAALEGEVKTPAQEEEFDDDIPF